MGTAERRSAIMKILCRRRHETISNLASEFGVSERTIRRDIEVLSLTEPLYTQSGRYGGGVYIMDGYSDSYLYMTDEEANVLYKLYKLANDQQKCLLTVQELSIFKNILAKNTELLC